MSFKDELKEILTVAQKTYKSQGGFTLLELLVVVAILAAIAGTATIALKDTDARASAAAHVAMMDELNKGIRTYRVLKRNELPSRFDSLLAEDGTDPGMLGFDPAGDAVIAAIPTDVQQIMLDGGIASMMYIDNDNTNIADLEGAVAGTTDCSSANIKALISSRTNAVVAGNIFLPPAGNGCGIEMPFDTDDDGTADATVSGVFWNGGSLRLTGQEDVTAANYYGDGNFVYLLTGIGPASTLFDTNDLGGMTTVPVYRHVKPDEYNRFIAVWNVGTYSGSTDGTDGIVAGDQCELVAVVDGALDTKEEELGEWDGTRNTI